MRVKASSELIDQLLYNSYPQVPKVNHAKRKDIEMSPIFLAIKQRDLPLLTKLVELGKQHNQIKYMVNVTCNGIPPGFYALQRMEKLLDQAMKLARGE